MAKAVEPKSKTKAAKAPTQKDIFMDAIGVALAADFPDMDVVKVKPAGVPECVHIDMEGTSFTVIVTQKKAAVEIDEEDIKRNFTAELEEAAE